MLIGFRSRIEVFCGLLLCVASELTAGPPVATTDPLPPAEQKAKFKLPPGFDIQLVASEPDIQKPMNLAFDAKGRLWVTHSIEYPFAPENADQSRDGLTVLDGIGPDGKATKVTKFADRLNIPIGVLPMPNGREVIVWSIPNIWKLTDTDGDGKADKREILYGPFDFVDTHGNQNSFRLGLDGWIYACHGFRNSSKIKLKGEGPVVLEMSSGNTYRFKPDGSAIEQISWGQVNPFGMCVDFRGDLFNADCHSKPITLLLREGYYDSFGKPHDGLGFAPIATSDDHGSTGIAGIVAYSSPHFPADYDGSMFVGNVVTNIVHRDRPQWRGSSPWIEKPENFLTCDDWWFHPVDLQLGPDGCLYVCDFYNSIIGHYEVDLKHPLRDRHRGRIWRIVYKGEGDVKLPKVPKVTEQNVDQLIEGLSDKNTANRHFAAFELEQRFKDVAITRLTSRLSMPLPASDEPNARRADERVQTLWMLWRNGRLDDALIQKLATDPSSVVRIHLVKSLGETKEWNGTKADVVRAAVKDPDPFVRRAAAEALGRHPDPANIQMLVNLWKSTAKDDVQLVHATRIALRNQIRSATDANQIAKLPLTNSELSSVVEIAMAVKNDVAARYVFDDLRSRELPTATVEKSLTHVATNISPERLDELAVYITSKFPKDFSRQMRLFQSIFSGLNQRGIKLSSDSAMGHWAIELIAKVFDPRETPVLQWESTPLPEAPTASPWGIRSRRSADGVADAFFFDSIVNGEQLTGTLRSAPFDLPPTLTFWLCGHNGEPGTSPPPVNLVRLRLSETGEVIQKEVPPRDDTARQIKWDLTKWSGKRAVFEAVDASSKSGYAWLGVGRFEPAVVTNPTPDFLFAEGPLATAIQVVDQLKLEKYAGAIVDRLNDVRTDLAVRQIAAQAGLNLARAATISALSTIVQNAEEPSTLRTKAAQMLGAVNTAQSREALAAALRTAPAPLQQPIAVALAGTREGGELLFTLVGSGRASARLLQDKPVLDRLAAASIPDREKKIEELTRGIPDADERMKKTIASFSSRFAGAQADPNAGVAVFKKACFTCHRIGDQGGKVGPQLDGVGNRGLERLLEDVLDPNRNVDGAFRATVVETKNGLIVTGLKLREEGTTLILGDNQGKEVRVPAEEIEEQRLSNLSPMPSNFAEQLNEDDLRALIAYLLQQRQQVKQQEGGVSARQ